jgi:predicted lysophospholipase L1 biosynthesis ABC-type transport system permease subunit
MLEPIVSTPQSRRAYGRAGSAEKPSRGYMVAVSAIGVVIVTLIVLLIVGGGSSTSPSGSSTATRRHSSRVAHHPRVSRGHAVSPSALVALSLRATAVVYVCLIGDNGAKLIPGTELQPGESTPIYRARRFEITLGNNSVTMFVDGIARTVPASSQAIGYSITKANGRQPLAPSQLPTCT